MNEKKRRYKVTVLGFISILFGISALIGFQNCGTVKPSTSESAVLLESPFSLPAGEVQTTSQYKTLDSIPIANPLSMASLSEATPIQRCTSSAILQRSVTGLSGTELEAVMQEQAEIIEEIKARELSEAIAKVKSDPSGRTILAEYSISFGQAIDETARNANRRAILGRGKGPLTLVPVQEDPSHRYYWADHTDAKLAYVSGDRCFYSTLRITGELNLGFPPDMSWHQYALNWTHDRLPEPVSNPTHLSTEDIKARRKIRLFVADIREGFLGLTDTSRRVIHSDLFRDTERGVEGRYPIKQLFELSLIHQYMDGMIQSLSRDRDASGSPTVGAAPLGEDGSGFRGMVDGTPQLFDNMRFLGLDGIITSTQYTPVVLDLGRKGIRTSSLSWGTFFNMANIFDKTETDPNKKFNIRHLTAWLGGVPSNIGQGEGNSYYSLVADDGFLVLPRADGKIISARELFSSFTEVNGRTYSNGFQALAALANKDCNSSEISKKYFGPWDGDLFTSKVKVWIDRDRNGVADALEIISLPAAQIGAINTCHLVQAGAHDAYGNSTEMRSTFLYMDKDEKIIGNDQEILERIKTSIRSDGRAAEFRQAIDILFQTNQYFYLENIPKENIQFQVN